MSARTIREFRARLEQKGKVLVQDQTYALRGPDNTEEHYALVKGQVYGPWDNRGAALAGLATEQRRAAKRKEKK